MMEGKEFGLHLGSVYLRIFTLWIARRRISICILRKLAFSYLWQQLTYRTSAVFKHSLSGTLTTAQAIIIAVGKPLMAKLSDV